MSSKILHKHCFHFPLGMTMVSSENKSNTYANLKDKQYYGIFESGLNTSVIESLFIRLDQLNTSMHSGCFALLWPLLNSSHRLTFLIAVSWTLELWILQSFFSKTRRIWKDDLLVELLCVVASKNGIWDLPDVCWFSLRWQPSTCLIWWSMIKCHFFFPAFIR